MAANNSWNALLALGAAPKTAETSASFTNLLTDAALPEPGLETAPALRPAPADSRKIAEALIRSMVSAGAGARRQPATFLPEAASFAISIPIMENAAAPDHPALPAAPEGGAAENGQHREPANVTPGGETKRPEATGSTQILPSEVKKPVAQENVPARTRLFANREMGSSSTGHEAALPIPLTKEAASGQDRGLQKTEPPPPVHCVFATGAVEKSSTGAEAALSTRPAEDEPAAAPPARPALLQFATAGVSANRARANSSTGDEAELPVSQAKEESAAAPPARARGSKETEPAPAVFANRPIENRSTGQEGASAPLREESARVAPARDRSEGETEQAPPLSIHVARAEKPANFAMAAAIAGPEAPSIQRRATLSTPRAKEATPPVAPDRRLEETAAGQVAAEQIAGRRAGAIPSHRAKASAGQEASPNRRQAANREIPAQTRHDAQGAPRQTIDIHAIPATAVNTQQTGGSGSDSPNSAANHIAPESPAGEGSTQDARTVSDGTDSPAPPPDARVEATPAPAPGAIAPLSTGAPIAFTARLTLSPPDVSPALPPVSPPAPKPAAEQSAVVSSKDGPPAEKMEPVKKIETSAGKPREEKADEDAPLAAGREAAEIVRNAPEPATAIERLVSANTAAERKDGAEPAPAPRMTEVPTMPPAPAPPASAQQIAVRISPNNGAAVDLHVAQRGGEIHVSVRTPDAALQSSLRQDLGTLANSLERAGYRAETFTPRGVAAAAPRQEAMPLPHSRGSGPDTPPGGRGGSGASSNPRQRQQGRGRGPKNWLEELENSK